MSGQIPDSLSIVIPALNEAAALKEVLPDLRERYPDAEVIVVDDGSSDDTVALCEQNQVCCISHPESLGNGAAVKTGARAATGEVIVFMDGDGQHRPSEIAPLLEQLAPQVDLVVGARSAEHHASLPRRLGNEFYNRLASWMTGRKVHDLTSGMKAVRRERFLEFLHLLPNGFSYDVTITMAFMKVGYGVRYVPIEVHQRLGTSHIRLLADGLKFILIIFRIATLYSPLKLFTPIAATLFVLGLIQAVWAGFLGGVAVLLWVGAVIVFLLGLLSEQITMLIYKP